MLLTREHRPFDSQGDPFIPQGKLKSWFGRAGRGEVYPAEVMLRPKVS